MSRQWSTRALLVQSSPPCVLTLMLLHAIAQPGILAHGNIAAIPAGQQEFVDAGTASAIVAAVRAHPSIADIAENACDILGYISLFPAGQQACIDADAPSVIIAG